jgi:hypothetical protein
LKGLLLAAALVAAACAGGAAGAGGPRLSAMPSSFDFGNVLPEKTLQTDVVLRNVGSAELVIKDVRTTCHCTVVGGYAKRLAPGASTSLRIELTTPALAGPVAQTVTIESNDPDQPTAEVEVKASVIASSKPAPR